MYRPKSVARYSQHLLFIFLLLLVNASAKEKSYNLKPYDYIATEIINNKVVMLADHGAFSHFTLSPHISLLNIIEAWEKKLKEDKIQNRNLVLILEKSPSVINLINHYFELDDLTPFLDKCGDIYSLEDLYLLERLKKISREIKINNNSLKILGFEIDEGYEDEYYFKHSESERDIYFAKYRDSLINNEIINYTRLNPKDNIIIYYGNAHLCEEYSPKIKPSQNYDGKGFYLAYYLRRDFGKDKLLTIDQASIPNDQFSFGDEFSYLKNQIFLVGKRDAANGGSSPFSEFTSDWTIVKHDEFIGPHFIRNIFSKNSLLRSYKKLLNIEKLCLKYSRKFSFDYFEADNTVIASNLEPLMLITGSMFGSLDQCKSYIDSTSNYYLHEIILKKEFSDRLYVGLKNKPHDSSYRLMLYGLGVSYYIYLRNDLCPSEEEWNNLICKPAMPSLEYFDNVGLLWVGTDVEKEKSKHFLRKQTGADYNNAADYLEWYYKNKYNFVLN